MYVIGGIIEQGKIYCLHHRTNKIGKDFFRLLKKNFPLSSNLCKIFNKNTFKLSYICILNKVNLVNRSNTKISEINNVLSPLNVIASL